MFNLLDSIFSILNYQSLYILILALSSHKFIYFILISILLNKL